MMRRLFCGISHSFGSTLFFGGHCDFVGFRSKWIGRRMNLSYHSHRRNGQRRFRCGNGVRFFHRNDRCFLRFHQRTRCAKHGYMGCTGGIRSWYCCRLRLPCVFLSFLFGLTAQHFLFFTALFFHCFLFLKSFCPFQTFYILFEFLFECLRVLKRLKRDGSRGSLCGHTRLWRGGLFVCNQWC